MTTEEKVDRILSELSEIKRMLPWSSTPPSYQPGGKDWRVMMGDGEVRAYNRKKGVERRKGR